jgi:hypothetical protein
MGSLRPSFWILLALAAFLTVASDLQLMMPRYVWIIITFLVGALSVRVLRRGARLGVLPVTQAPGARAERVLAWLPGDKETKVKVFGQTIADMREEYIEAIAAGNALRQRAVWLRGHIALAFTFVAYVGSLTVKRVIEVWKLVS